MFGAQSEAADVGWPTGASVRCRYERGGVREPASTKQGPTKGPLQMSKKPLANAKSVRHRGAMLAEPTTIVQSAIRAILARIDFFQSVSQVPDSSIGRLAASDSNIITRLRGGENITVEKLERLERWVSSADPHADYDVRRRSSEPRKAS